LAGYAVRGAKRRIAGLQVAGLQVTIVYALRITHYALRITHYALRITHYALRITHYALRITHSPDSVQQREDNEGGA
jgi:hypothetical protein